MCIGGGSAGRPCACIRKASATASTYSSNGTRAARSSRDRTIKGGAVAKEAVVLSMRNRLDERALHRAWTESRLMGACVSQSPKSIPMCAAQQEPVAMRLPPLLDTAGNQLDQAAAGADRIGPCHSMRRERCDRPLLIAADPIRIARAVDGQRDDVACQRVGAIEGENALSDRPVVFRRPLHSVSGGDRRQVGLENHLHVASVAIEDDHAFR